MYVDYWGKDTLERLFNSSERTLAIPGSIWRQLGIVNPAGKLYLRDEYKLFYDRTVHAAQRGTVDIPGVVITGQPGIGWFGAVFVHVPTWLTLCQASLATTSTPSCVAWPKWNR